MSLVFDQCQRNLLNYFSFITLLWTMYNFFVKIILGEYILVIFSHIRHNVAFQTDWQRIFLIKAYLNNPRISLNYPRQFEVGRSVLFPSCCKICHITWDPSHHASKLVLGSRHRWSLLHLLFSHLSPWNVSSLSTVTLQPCDLRRFPNFYSTVHYIGMKFIIKH